MLGWLRNGGVRPKLAVGKPDDPEEKQADEVADRVMDEHNKTTVDLFGSASPPNESTADEDETRNPTLRRQAAATGSQQPAGPRSVQEVLRSPGNPLDTSSRAFFEPRFGRDFSDVRTHTGTAATDSARSIQALAYTSDHHIVFNSGQFAPTTPHGRRLLAHELTHIVQQDRGRHRVQLWPDQRGTFRDPNAGVMSDVPGAIPGDAMDPTSGMDVDETVRVMAPVLDRRRRGRDRDQTYHLHSAIITQIPISAYAISRSRLTLDAEATIPAAGGASTAPPPAIAPGTTVYGPTRLPHAVLSADATNVIVEGSTTIHYAVGAGSCVLVQTNSGWYLFDAGINLNEPHAMAEAIADKIAARLRGEPLRAIFLTHAHYDHVSLIPRLARRIQIDAIVANPLQFAREEYVTIRESTREADLARRAAEMSRIEADVQAREAFVDSLERSGSADAINAQDMEQRWREEVARRVEAMYPKLTEAISLPVRGRGGLEFETVGTQPIHGGEAQRSVAVEDLLPSGEGTELRGAVDPDLYGREMMREGEVDRMSTTYLVTIAGNRRIIMPDLRRTDVNRLARELQETLGSQTVEFQEWVSGHHMQIGWQEGVVSARTMHKTLELLHDFRARGRGGRPGRDAVIASVDPAQVDAAQIRLLRLLGFETYLAQSQADVHTYEVLSGIRGVRGPLAPDARGEPTLQRSMAARRSLDNEIAQLIERRSHAATPRERGEIRTDIANLRQRINRIKSLELALIEAAQARDFDAAAMARAETALNEALDTAGVGRVVTSSSQLSDTALVLLREPLGPEPELGTPEAEQRARDAALRQQKQRVDLLRERAQGISGEGRQDAYAELYAELAQYEHLLATEAENAGPGVTREVAGAESHAFERIAPAWRARSGPEKPLGFPMARAGRDPRGQNPSAGR